MTPKNRKALSARVARTAWPELSARGYVSPIDVLVGIGWLAPDAAERWRRGQTDYLERVVQANLSRISEAMKILRSWAAAQGLSASRTKYLTRRPYRRALRFSKSGHPNIEASYRTHWVSPKLAGQKRERLAEKAKRAAEAVETEPLARGPVGVGLGLTPDRTSRSTGHAARSTPSVSRPAATEIDPAAVPAAPSRHAPETLPAPRC
jgi:hypothetical protein